MSDLLDIGMEIDDAVEPYAVPEGEYDVEIVRVDPNPDAHYIRLGLEILHADFPYAKAVTGFVNLPTKPGLTPKQMNGSKNGLKKFFTCFGIDSTPPWDVENWVGSAGKAFLRVEETEAYGEQNKVGKFLVG